MDLNTVCIGLLFLPLLYGLYIYYTQPSWIIPAMPKALWGEQVGRSKHIQSKTGDASLFTQGARRRATKNGGFQRGFMSAAIDYFFISRICPCTKIPVVDCKCKCCDVIDGGEGAGRILSDLFDGGNATTNFSDCTVDGGAVIHGNNCECCPTDGGEGAGRILPDMLDGGEAGTNFTNCAVDGGVGVYNQSCGGCSVANGGDGAAKLLQDMLDGGGAIV